MGNVPDAVSDGSSPRTWGIRLAGRGAGRLRRFIPTCVGHTAGRLRLRNRVARFIPTCVGHTPPWPARASSSTVHPHVRGAYHFTSRPLSETYGSSPRAWGIRRCEEAAPVRFRFIPTCVGHTSWNISQAFSITGSSPRAWGIRLYHKR